MTNQGHVPVLSKEVFELLHLKKGDTVLDCTVGLGGHAEGILKIIGEEGFLIGLDRDPENLEFVRERLAPYKNKILIHGNFQFLEELHEGWPKRPVSGILFDLGLSSPHVDNPKRGFSFQKEGPLDMRFDRRQHTTASDIINHYPLPKLIFIFKTYGEEPHAKEIAQHITEYRRHTRFTSTTQFAEFLRKYIKGKPGRDPATRIFQALRIATNNEIEALEKGLLQAIKLLSPYGRIVVITYHSLEDRVSKNAFRYAAADCVCPKEIPVCQCGKKPEINILTKKPIVPSYQEIIQNPRSRSAKLRAAEKLP